jgi:hypothetical protein
VRNYVEPFAGSLAVLLGRPSTPKIETVNDLDCWIANFWRALQADPEALAHHADWPVNEADLHARHLWLVKQTDFRERMKTDPEYFDAKIAGWWVWGISQWIGSGWCSRPDWAGRANASRAPRGLESESVVTKRPYLSNHGGGMGVHGSLDRKRPRLGGGGRGVSRQIPNLGNRGRGVSRQIPNLRGDSGAAGSGIHASGTYQKMPHIAGREWGIRSEVGMERREGGMYDWFEMLATRLRRVRVCCGDWKRILGPAPTTCIGTTGVFLDPPYDMRIVSGKSTGRDGHAPTDKLYDHHNNDVSAAVREWALANGDNSELRIALCGYEGEHEMPKSWRVVAWKANGGFGNQAAGDTPGRTNARRERIWFSPYCLSASLFE